MVGTENHIELEVLEEFVNKTPKEILTGRAALNLKESSYQCGREKNTKTVSAFIVNFAFMAHPDKARSCRTCFKPSILRDSRSWGCLNSLIMNMTVCLTC